MQPSFPSILLRFFLVLVAVTIVLSGLIWMFPALENASMAVIAGIVAAMAAGQHYYSMTSRVPTGKESWRYALAFVFLEILVTIPVVFLLFRDMWVQTQGWLNVFLLILALLLLVKILAARWIFLSGAKQMAKHTKT